MRLFVPLCLFVVLLATASASNPLAEPGIKFVLTKKLLEYVERDIKREIENRYNSMRFNAYDNSYKVLKVYEPTVVKTSFIPNEVIQAQVADSEPCRRRSEFVDPAFIGQQIGGFKFHAEGVKFDVEKVGEEGIFHEERNGKYSSSIYYGQIDGKFKLAKMVVVDLGTISESVELCAIRTKIIDEVLERRLADIQRVQEEMPQLVPLGRKAFFDLRFTDHLHFTEEAAEFNFVGRCFYDYLNTYSNVTLPGSQYGLLMLSMLRDVQEPPKKEDRYSEKFILYDTDATPKVDALSSEGSDTAEENRRSNTHMKFFLHQDLINSFYETMVRSKWLSFNLPRDMIATLIEEYNSGKAEGERYDTNKIPQDLSLRVHLNELEEGSKMIRFEDGNVKKKELAFGVTYGGLTADYTLKAQTKFILRNEKFAFDINKFIITKEADQGFPRFITEESLKNYLDEFVDHAYGFITAYLLPHMTEYRLQNNYAILGYDIAKNR